MPKKAVKKRRSAQDATLINIRALKKRVTRIERAMRKYQLLTNDRELY